MNIIKNVGKYLEKRKTTAELEKEFEEYPFSTIPIDKAKKLGFPDYEISKMIRKSLNKSLSHLEMRKEINFRKSFYDKSGNSCFEGDELSEALAAESRESSRRGAIINSWYDEDNLNCCSLFLEKRGLNGYIEALKYKDSNSSTMFFEYCEKEIGFESFVLDIFPKMRTDYEQKKAEDEENRTLHESFWSSLHSARKKP